MRKPPSPKLDRAIAMGIWVVTGLLTGVALSIFVNGGIIWLGVGLLIGLFLAFRLTKPEQRIEDD
jgi:hypothetical protein